MLWNLFRKGGSRKRKANRSARKARPATQMSVEALEARELMAASLTASRSAGVLRIEGTEGADLIRVRQVGDQISLESASITVGGSSQASVAAGQVNAILI